MMSMYGANPEQLNGLGRSMKQQKVGDRRGDQRGQLRAGRHGVGGPGAPAVRERLEHDVQGALNRLNEAFEVAGTDCINRSADLQRVMGAR